MNRKIRVLALFLICLMALPLGCSKKTPDGPVRAEYYPDCHEPLAYLRDRHSGTGKRVAMGAAKGGLISGIATAIAASITGNFRAVGVLAGVAAGAAVGGIVAGTSGEDKEENIRMNKYLEEIDGDINDMDFTQASATVSRQCYNKAFAALKTDVRAGKIGVNAARDRFREIVAGEDEAAQLLKNQPQNAEMEEEFEQAIRGKK